MKQAPKAIKEDIKPKTMLAIQDLISAQNQFKKLEDAYELHYLSTMSRDFLPIRDNKPYYRDCLVFLLYGELISKDRDDRQRLATRIVSSTRLSFGFGFVG